MIPGERLSVYSNREAFLEEVQFEDEKNSMFR